MQIKKLNWQQTLAIRKKYCGQTNPQNFAMSKTTKTHGTMLFILIKN